MSKGKQIEGLQIESMTVVVDLESDMAHSSVRSGF